MIVNALYKLIWSIFIQGPLNIIASFNTVLNYLTGGVIGDLFFGHEEEFSFQSIPMAFWYFVITAVCLFSLIFAVTIIKILFQDKTETKTKFVVALQNGAKAFAFIFLIPIFFFIVNFAIGSMAKAITTCFGGENGNIANFLYNIGNTKWVGTADNVSNNYVYPENIDDYNMIAQIFGVWFMLFSLFMIAIALVQKVIELFFLFVISPWVMVAMTIDNGHGAFIWKDMVIAKFFASTATLTGYFIFMTTIQTILTSNLAGLGIEGIGKSLFTIVFMCGGGLAVMAFSDVVANLIGEAAGVREGMSSIKSTVAGGMMALGAAKMAGKALGFTKSKRAKKALALGGAGDKTLNTMGLSDDSNDEDNNKTNSSAYNKNQPLDFRHFWHATEGMSSRAGIVGLAGFGLGVTTLATSKLVGAARGGKVKGFFRQVGKVIATPFVAVGRKFNPRLVRAGSQENRTQTTDFYKKNIDSFNKQIGKLEHKFTRKKSFSYLNAVKKSQIKHNQKFSVQNLNEKQRNINDVVKNHTEKQNKRQNKWDEKAVKKAEKKKS